MMAIVQIIVDIERQRPWTNRRSNKKIETFDWIEESPRSLFEIKIQQNIISVSGLAFGQSSEMF